MISLEPFFSSLPGDRPDPVLAGVTRGLAAAYEPLIDTNLPADLADLVRRLDERTRGRADEP